MLITSSSNNGNGTSSTTASATRYALIEQCGEVEAECDTVEIESETEGPRDREQPPSSLPSRGSSLGRAQILAAVLVALLSGMALGGFLVHAALIGALDGAWAPLQQAIASSPYFAFAVRTPANDTVANDSARPATPYFTFTIPPVLEGRWPPSRTWNGTASPIAASNITSTARLFVNPAEPIRFPSVRGAVTTLWGPGQAHDFNKNAANNDKNFFGPQRDHQDWFIFYSVFPVNVRDEMLAAVAKEQWVDVGLDVQQRWPNFTLDTTGVTRWRTPLGATVYTWPIAINLPDFFVWEAGLTMRDDWFYCFGKRWGFNYVHYTHAPTYQLLHHPVLMQGYDFILKFDFDVEFYEPVPTNVFLWMAQNDCPVMHSEIRKETASCQEESAVAFNRYSSKQQRVPKSANYSWWNDDNYHIYGNFMAVSTAWAQSPEMQMMAKWLFDDRETSGYYKHRWGDQGSMIRMYGSMFDVTTAQLHSLEQVPGTICNTFQWRDRYFRHGYH